MILLRYFRHFDKIGTFDSSHLVYTSNEIVSLYSKSHRALIFNPFEWNNTIEIMWRRKKMSIIRLIRWRNDTKWHWPMIKCYQTFMYEFMCVFFLVQFQRKVTQSVKVWVSDTKFGSRKIHWVSRFSSLRFASLLLGFTPNTSSSYQILWLCLCDSNYVFIIFSSFRFQMSAKQHLTP